MNFFLLKEWLIYFHLKTDEHSLHSPFFFRFYKEHLKSGKNDAYIHSIETQRQKLLKSEQTIEVQDLGAGSKTLKSDKRKIKDIAKNSLSSPKFSLLLNQLIKQFHFKQIVELGTSLGVNTAYLADADTASKIYTFEGDENLIDIAKSTCAKYKNIQFIKGNINECLPHFLLDMASSIDLVYLDANHTYEATLNYFNQLLPHHHSGSIFIFDDIHWSSGMKQAWKKIKQHPEVKSTIDIFDAGFVFFNPDFEKQHYILNF
ncbi:O-methyltransferase [Marivirga lumbricoides]|uniref:O-methyltransferase n=1 Tax=Marivirga lumbricoides TaxID=1046115 RepID=A0ABQ1L681_9BACT|nr:O-methyltransferase [Marivirga lumbricoides]